MKRVTSCHYFPYLVTCESYCLVCPQIANWICFLSFPPPIFKPFPICFPLFWSGFVAKYILLSLAGKPQFHGDLFSRNFKCPAARYQKQRGFCSHFLSFQKGEESSEHQNIVTSSSAWFLWVSTLQIIKIWKSKEKGKWCTFQKAQSDQWSHKIQSWIIKNTKYEQVQKHERDLDYWDQILSENITNISN